MTSCDATTSPRYVTAFRQHLLCRHPIPASLRQLLTLVLWLVRLVSSNHRSTQDPFYAGRRSVGTSGDICPPFPKASRWFLFTSETCYMEATSKAPCLRSAPHAIGWPSLGGSYCTSRLPIPRQLGHDRSTQDPPSPADEARVLRVTQSTLLPLTTSVAWAVSEAPYIGGSLPPDAQSSCSP